MGGNPAQPNRILVLTSTYPRWPGDTLPPFVHELARRLTSEFEIHVLAPHTEGAKTTEQIDGVFVHRFHYLPARFETLAYKEGMLPGLRARPWRALLLPPFLLMELAAAVRLLRNRRFAVLHAHWLLPHGLIALIAASLCGYRPRVICTSHGADIYGLRGALSVYMKRLVAQRCTSLIMVSTAIRDELATQLGKPVPCEVLSMGVDTQTRFTPSGRAATRGNVLFVGRLAEKKGVPVLLKALARLPAQTGIKLRIIGGGQEEARLRALAAELDLSSRVDFLGPIPNEALAEHYRRAAIVAFPSIVAADGDQEGLGLVSVEAMACGCAVVASNLPAIRDVVRHEQTGLLFEPGDEQGLAQALQRLADDAELREKLAAAGREFVVKRFDWRYITQCYATIYRNALA